MQKFQKKIQNFHKAKIFKFWDFSKKSKFSKSQNFPKKSKLKKTCNFQETLICSMKCERHSTRHIIRQFPCRVDPYLVVSIEISFHVSHLPTCSSYVNKRLTKKCIYLYVQTHSLGHVSYVSIKQQTTVVLLVTWRCARGGAGKWVYLERIISGSNICLQVRSSPLHDPSDATAADSRQQ